MIKLWMPMNKDLRNQGLKLTFPTGGGEIVNDNRFGKVWHTSSASSIDTLLPFDDWNWTQKTVGFGGWLKFNLNDVRFASAATYTSTNKNMTTNIFGHGVYAGYSLDVTSNYLYPSNPLTTLKMQACARDSGGYAYTAEKTIVFDEWHHVYVQFKPSVKTIEMYYDGEFFSSGRTDGMKLTANTNTFKINYPGIWGGNGITKSIPFYVHDVILCDQEINATDIKMLYNGKVFDIKGCNIYPSVSNLAPYPRVLRNADYGWDASLHPNAVVVDGYSGGYNSGVQSAETGYHAYWTLIDGIPTIVYKDINSQFGAGYKHRWLGVNGCYNLTGKIGASTKYTISMEAKADVAGKQISTGLYYRPHASISNAFRDGCTAKSLTTDWKRYYWHYTTSAAVETINSVYIYGQNGSIEGTAYVRNIQVELGHQENQYSYSDRIPLAYENSGRGVIMTPTNVVQSGDTMYFNGVDSGVMVTDPSFSKLVDGPYTFSFWVYSLEANSSRSVFFGGGNQGNGWTLQFEKTADNNYFRVYNNGSPDWNIAACTIPANTWIHLVVTRNGSTCKVYKGGTFVAQNTSFNEHTTFDNTYYIGRDTRTGDTAFKGYISDFKCFATELSADDIKSLWRKEYPRHIVGVTGDDY